MKERAKEAYSQVQEKVEEEQKYQKKLPPIKKYKASDFFNEKRKETEPIFNKGQQVKQENEKEKKEKEKEKKNRLRKQKLAAQMKTNTFFLYFYDKDDYG